jgi:hypothetical protein
MQYSSALPTRLTDPRTALSPPILLPLQDNDGNSNTAIVSGSQSAKRLIDAIAAAGGPTYTFLEIAPVDDKDGGIPGGNIRVAFLYDASRVELAPSVTRRAGEPTEAASVAQSGTNINLSVNPGMIHQLCERLAVVVSLLSCDAVLPVLSVSYDDCLVVPSSVRSICRPGGPYKRCVGLFPQAPGCTLRSQVQRSLLLCCQQPLYLQGWLSAARRAYPASCKRW